MKRKVEVRGWYGKEAVVGDWSGGIWVDILTVQKWVEGKTVDW